MVYQRPSIKALSPSELAEQFASYGLPDYRCSQIQQWIWAKGARSFSEMSNLPKDLRLNLEQAYTMPFPKVVARQISMDGTRKYLIEYDDGISVETVGIPSHDGARLTVCFSTQAGCPMGCIFCATGHAGFTRNLNIGEMVDQIRIVQEDFDQRVTNVVAMGQGESFLNYDATLSALRIMNSSNGLGIGARHITVSTCGVIEGIEKLSEEQEQFTLAVSLHSAVQSTRDFIMPSVARYTLPMLRSALKRYGDETGRRPTLEFAMMKDINDSSEELDALLTFCSGMLCHVNLIPLNPITKDSDEFAVAPSHKLLEFEKALSYEGIEASIRSSRGGDIDGACGQLRQRIISAGQNR